MQTCEGYKYTAHYDNVLVEIRARTIRALVEKLKKATGINCRTTHAKQIVFSEFRTGAYGIYFWHKYTGRLNAWIEFEPIKEQAQ